MTVAELRRLLELFPADAEVFFDPCGTWDPQSVEQVSRRLLVVHTKTDDKYFVEEGAKVVGGFSSPREVVVLGS